MLPHPTPITASAAALAPAAHEQSLLQGATLTQVATFEQQVTGVAVTPDGRIFVNFPRWEEDVAISVGELKDGRVTPYPNAEWNAWRNAKPLSRGDHLICVQSVFSDGRGNLWILDPAAPGNEFNLDGGPKLVRVDLKTDQVAQVVLFDRTAVPQGSYLNDVRISPDGAHAYITDSGIRGALIVVELESGRASRLLDGDASTQVEPDVQVKIDGKPLKRPDGRGPMFAADGIAMTATHLYWQALTGRTLYRLPLGLLNAPPANLATRVERVGTTCVADGLWSDAKGRFWVTSPEDNSVKHRMPDGTLRIAVQDKRLRWPDTMAEGADGSLYVTSSQIQDMAQFHDHGSTRTEPYALWKFTA